MCVVEGEGVCVCVRLKGEGIVATGGVPSGYATAHTS